MSQVQKVTNLPMVQSGIDLGCGIGGSKFDSKLEGRWGWFTIFHVREVKKAACIIGIGKGNAFLGLQYLEAKKIMEMS